MRDLDPTVQAALQSGVICPAIMAQLAFKSSTQYCWTGYGNLGWGGNTFLGVGSFGGVGTITEGLTVRADGTTVSLSGIDPTLYAASMDDVQVGATANIWFALLSQGVLLGDPYLMFGGQVDKPTVTTGAESITISLALENRMRLLQRPSSRRYTLVDQRRYFPTDTAFSWVELLNDIALRWGS